VQRRRRRRGALHAVRHASTAQEVAADAQPRQRRLELAGERHEAAVDKAPFTVGKISPNGLLEINRQRIQQALLVRTTGPAQPEG
jgi:Ribonuclease G/E